MDEVICIDGDVNGLHFVL